MLKYYRDGRPTTKAQGLTSRTTRSFSASGRARSPTARPVSRKAGRLRFEDATKDVVNDYTSNGRTSVDAVRRRLALHLQPFFGGRRMSDDHHGRRPGLQRARLTRSANPATINRELAVLKRAFTLAVRAGTLVSKPHIPMLEEHNVRTGFFEREQFEAVCTHLPRTFRPVMAFAYLTGWRVRSEVLPLTWAQVDEQAQIVRLEVGTTKNHEGRTFPYGALPELRRLLTAQGARQGRAAGTGHHFARGCSPTSRAGRLPAFYAKLWREACRLAGCPGKIPHDFRRTAVRNLVRAGVPEKVAMLLTGHKTRSVFDRYDIVNEADLRSAVSSWRRTV